MAKYRTALGKTVDMAALAAKNEKVRAISNVKNLNARGDTIDSNGRVITPATQKVGDQYAKTVGNKSAQPARHAPSPTAKQAEPKPQLTTEELELDASLNDDLAIEQIKAAELKGKK